MKKLILLFGLLTGAFYTSSAAELNARAVLISDNGTTYLVRIEYQANTSNITIGSSNVVVTFNANALEFPSSIDTTRYDVYNLFSGGYDGSNPIQVAGNEITINVLLNNPNTNTVTLPSGSTWMPVLDLEFVHVNSGELPNIQFDESHVLWFAQEGDDVTPLDNGTFTEITTPINVTWVGTTTNWSLASNWLPNTNVPNTVSNVIIPTTPSGGNFPSLSTSTTIGNVTLQNGARLSLAGNQLTVNGVLSGTGTIRGSATSSIVFSGSAATGILMDQTTPGTTNLVQNITINNTGGITLGNTMEIIGVVTPTAGTLVSGGNLTLGSTAVGTYGQIAGGNATITGNVVMEKTLSNANPGWRQIGFPLTATFGGLTGVDVLGSGHSTANQRNVFFWDATGNGSNVATGWTAANTGTTANRGYALFGDNGTGLHDITTSWALTGTVNNGQMDYTVDNSTDPNTTGTNDNGWNLIPNPYPSNLDISTLWNTTLNGLAYKAIHLYDQTSSQYVAITNSGVTILPYNNTNQSGLSSTVIAPFQAFWVKSDIDATISLNNANRTTNMAGMGTFMKKEYDLARLDVFGQDSAWDQTVIYFHDEATSGFDGTLDAYNLVSMNPDVPNLFAVTDEGSFSITALSTGEFEHTVPLGFNNAKTGEMSFNLNDADLDNSWYVYMEDKTLGIFYDIKNKPYTFDHVQNSNTRFVLHFQKHALSAEKLVEDVKTMKVSGNGEEVFVFVPNHFRSQQFEVEVYDLQGRLVYANKQTNLVTGMNTLNINLENSAMYVVRVKASEGMVSGKVQIF